MDGLLFFIVRRGLCEFTLVCKVSLVVINNVSECENLLAFGFSCLAPMFVVAVLGIFFLAFFSDPGLRCVLGDGGVLAGFL